MLDKNAIYIVQNHVKAGLVDTAEQYPLRLAGKEKSAGASKSPDLCWPRNGPTKVVP
jgi:hypothetical protein